MEEKDSFPLKFNTRYKPKSVIHSLKWRIDPFLRCALWTAGIQFLGNPCPFRDTRCPNKVTLGTL